MLAASLVVLALGAGITIAQAGTSSRSLRVCAPKAGGAVRALGAGKACRRGEQLFTLGAPGATGAPGGSGAAGVAGSPGSPGAPGKDGTPGSPGQNGDPAPVPKDPAPAYQANSFRVVSAALGEQLDVSRVAGCREPVLGGAYEDCEIRLSRTPSPAASGWISEALGGTPMIGDLTIERLDLSSNVLGRLVLGDTFISRVELSPPDAADASNGYIDLTLTPTSITRSTGGSLTTGSHPATALFGRANFRVNIPSVNGSFFASVSAIGATIDKTPDGVGSDGRPRFVPGRVRPLPMTVGFSSSGTTETNLRSWLAESPVAPRDGTLEVLNASLSATLMTWSFGALQPTSGIDPFPSGTGNGRSALTLQPESVSVNAG